MALNCQMFSNYLFRRVPNFMPIIERDMFPTETVNLDLYENAPWESFTGTEHTWDRFHLAMPNDAGDWEQLSSVECGFASCDPEARQIDWGTTRAVFGKYRRTWKTRILCLDQLRNVEEAKQQFNILFQELKKIPNYVMGDWLKFQQVFGQIGNQTGSGGLAICGAAKISSSNPNSGLTLTAATFGGNQAGLQVLSLGSDANLPTSKLSMPYLQSLVPPLQYNGYFRGDFTPTGTFQCLTDMQSMMELCNANPALTSMYNTADFEKGGKFFKYGAMSGCGNFMFKVQPYPPRFYRTSTGTLTRVWPFQNSTTTTGIMPALDPQYDAAPFQISVIPNRMARIIYGGQVPEIHPELKFRGRTFGKWQWCGDAYLEGYDPTTGQTCTMGNPRRNKGYLYVDFENGSQNVKPELETVILHQRESTPVADMPRAAGNPITSPPTFNAQSLLPYNPFCNPYPLTDLQDVSPLDPGGFGPDSG